MVLNLCDLNWCYMVGHKEGAGTNFVMDHTTKYMLLCDADILSVLESYVSQLGLLLSNKAEIEL